MPEIGEKESDYLFKELYKLKSNDLMSSLRSQNPSEYPQTHSPSFPLCPVWDTVSQKKEVEVRHSSLPKPHGPQKTPGSSLPKLRGPKKTSHGCHAWA